MSNFNKSDVKNHLSLRFRARTYLGAPAGQPDVSGSLLVEPGAIGAGPSPFAEDHSAEHTTADISLTPIAKPIDFSGSQEPETPKSAQP
jgi:hypothetical protein